MATHKSQQMLQIASTYNPLDANEAGGVVRTLWFDFRPYYDGTVTLANGDVIRLGILPKDARVIEGHITVTDQGADAHFSLGISAMDGSGHLDIAATDHDDADRFMAATDAHTAAVDSAFANTAALYFGYVTEKPCWFNMTITTGTPDSTSASAVHGFLKYIVD